MIHNIFENETLMIDKTVSEHLFVQLDRLLPRQVIMSIFCYRFYHGKLDRQKAENRLHSSEKSKCYLVRQSDAHPAIYCISFKGQFGIKHFRISQLYGDYYIGSHQFTSLAGIVNYYTHNQDIIMGERLHHPISPPEVSSAVSIWRMHNKY